MSKYLPGHSSSALTLLMDDQFEAESELSSRTPELDRGVQDFLAHRTHAYSPESTLSDVPSDFEDARPSDWSPTLALSGRIRPVTAPPTPSKLEPNFDCSPTSKRNTFKVARAGAPKISPYFPNVRVEPESCLPFPPITAPAFGLIQEQLAHDPFRLLVATIFLNKTRGGVALPILFKVFDQYPTIDAMASAQLNEFVAIIHRLGFQNQRAKKCINLARTWLAQPPCKEKRFRKLHYPVKGDGRDIRPGEYIHQDDTRVGWEIAHLPGLGAYALDSWRIFCRDEMRGLAHDWKGKGASPDSVPEWKRVLPHDKELRAYLSWMWLKEGLVWDHHTGRTTKATEKAMRAARRGGVAHEQDGSWILETSPVKAVNCFGTTARSRR